MDSNNQDDIEALLNNIENIDITDVSEDDIDDELQGLTSDEKHNTTSGIFGLEGIKDEHKIVSQLDDVTKESEEKATEVFDIMNDMSNDLMWLLDKAQTFSESHNETVAKLTKIGETNPEIKEIVEDMEERSAELDEIQSISQHANQILMEGMSLMQYQDIGRQKIERVINIMRSLIGYLNLLFEGRKEDDNRTSSAKHLTGDDEVKGDVVESQTDLESLIDQYSQK